MANYVILATFTDQGVKTAKDSPKRADFGIDRGQRHRIRLEAVAYDRVVDPLPCLLDRIGIEIIHVDPVGLVLASQPGQIHDRRSSGWIG